MMREAEEIAEKLGLRLRISIEQRIEGAEKVGAHKTSMLQDVEAGRALEIAPLIGAFVELGQLTHTPMPATETIYSLVSLLDALAEQGGAMSDDGYVEAERPAGRARPVRLRDGGGTAGIGSDGTAALGRAGGDGPHVGAAPSRAAGRA